MKGEHYATTYVDSKTQPDHSAHPHETWKEASVNGFSHQNKKKPENRHLLFQLHPLRSVFSWPFGKNCVWVHYCWDPGSRS
jgi:hypothetical protein